MSSMAPKPKPIDRTPCIECDICGEAFDYREYWEPRFLIADDPQQSKTECDRCQKRAVEMYNRLTRNEKITQEW